MRLSRLVDVLLVPPCGAALLAEVPSMPVNKPISPFPKSPSRAAPPEDPKREGWRRRKSKASSTNKERSPVITCRRRSEVGAPPGHSTRVPQCGHPMGCLDQASLASRPCPQREQNSFSMRG